MPIPAWRAPIYRLLFPFAAGLILHERFAVARIHSIQTLVLLFGISWLTASLPVKWRWRFSYLTGLGLICLIMATGTLYGSLRDHRYRSDWVGNSELKKNYYLIRIRDEPIRTRSGWKIKADLLAQNDSLQNHPVSGGLLLYTRIRPIADKASPDQKAWIRLKFRPIANKPNQTFDFVRYCRLQKITHQAYLSDPDQIRFLPDTNKTFASFLHGTRIFIRSLLYREMKDSIRGGLATALFVGWKGGLDAELKKQYTRTGTIHIIAISGLHISLVFEILWRILYPLIFFRGGPLIRTLITLILIWVFCFLAGGEASVLRAGIMFTVTQLGRWTERPVSGLQALGLSMFFLLIADPDWLFDAGFQLSHGAVMGILLIQPILNRQRIFQNPILKNIWESTSLSIAATIGTFPFTAYYFHQFPWLFLPANLIAVPLSSLILVGLFLLIPLTSIPFLKIPLTRCVGWLIDRMNEWIEHLDRIPGTVWSW